MQNNLFYCRISPLILQWDGKYSSKTQNCLHTLPRRKQKAVNRTGTPHFSPRISLLSILFACCKPRGTVRHPTLSAASFPPAGARQELAVHRLWPQHPHGEDLRRPPQIHAAHHLRPAGPALPVAAQQWPGCCQRVLFPQRAPGGAAARGHEREDRHWQAGQDRVAHVRRRQSVELHLPGKRRWCRVTSWHECPNC